MLVRRIPNSVPRLRPWCRSSIFTSRRAISTQQHFSPSFPSLSPREFPSSGFEVLDPSEKIEEDTFPWYDRDEFYPVRIGMVFEGRYQVVSKLGYGTTPTVRLCRDLIKRKYWALKVHINTVKDNRELEIFKHLASANSEHPGQQFVRKLEDSFQIDGPHGKHDVFVMIPLAFSLQQLQIMQETEVFGSDLVIPAIEQVLVGLNFLHESNVTHTDLHAANLLVAFDDESICSKLEDSEVRNPSSRKQDGEHSIHTSRYVMGKAGPLVLSDFGQAVIGSECNEDAMPMVYRAPEIILKMNWGPAVDMWSLALLAWGLLEPKSLFEAYDRESGALNNAHHLARMTALLGPPPPAFLTRSEETSKYWNKDGEWIGPVPVPTGKTLESLVTNLSGDEKTQFLDFMRCLLCWLPEDRLDTTQISSHPWLRGKP